MKPAIIKFTDLVLALTENNCIREEGHLFKIIKGTGTKVGIPIWKCLGCKKKIQST